MGVAPLCVFNLVLFCAAHRDERQAQVSYLCEQTEQGSLIRERAGQHRVVFLRMGDRKTRKPIRPILINTSLNLDLDFQHWLSLRKLAFLSLAKELPFLEPRLEKQVGAEDDEQEPSFQRSHSDQFGDPA